MSSELPPTGSQPFRPDDHPQHRSRETDSNLNADPFAKLDTEDKLLLINENIKAVYTALEKRTGENVKEFYSTPTAMIEFKKGAHAQVQYIEKMIKSIPEQSVAGETKRQLERAKTAVIALHILLLSPEEQLALSLQGIATGSAAGLIFVEHEQFARGAAKSVRQVYVNIPLADRDEKLIIAKDNILVLPQAGLQYYIRKAEIEEELATARAFTDELNLPKNQNAVHQLKLEQLCKAAGCKNPPILSPYKTVGEFIAEMKKGTFLSADDAESKKLLAFCNNPQNSLILAALLDDSPHISLDLKMSNPQGVFDDQHPLVGKRGEDLEKAIQKPLTFQQRALLCYDMIDGLYKLHMLGRSKGMDGYVHGDPKPQNILVYEVMIDGKKYYYADIADLGKSRIVPTVPQGFASKEIYWGNSRFRCSEMYLSQLGDVQGYGFMIIRTLEEGCSTDGKPLYQSNRGSKGSNPNHRRMFEAFLITNPVCSQREIKHAFDTLTDYTGRFSSAAPSITAPSENEAQLATQEFRSYIDELIGMMKLIESANPQPDPQRLAAIEELRTLLYKMTDANPAKRITAEEALKSFPMALLRLPLQQGGELEEPSLGEGRPVSNTDNTNSS